MKNALCVFQNTDKMPTTKRVAPRVTLGWFLCLFFTRHFSKFQVLCSVLNLFDFDFPLTVGTEDQLQAEPAWLQCLGKENGISNPGPWSLLLRRRSGDRLPWDTAAPCWSWLGCKLPFFVLKHPSAFHRAVILPSATLPGSWVLNQLDWEQKYQQESSDSGGAWLLTWYIALHAEKTLTEILSHCYGCGQCFRSHLVQNWNVLQKWSHFLEIAKQAWFLIWALSLLPHVHISV